VIAVYDVGKILKTNCGPVAFSPETVTDILPTHYITVHQSAIRAIAWIRVPSTSSAGVPFTDEDPSVIASGGYDGVECLTDIREGTGCVMNRTRGEIYMHVIFH
jgi:transcription factor C subunit 6